MISVVVVSYNVASRLARCLESIGDAAEVIVVDNASPDGSADLVAKDFPAAKLLRFEENRGFAVAVNAGARLARYDALLVLNPDTVLSSAKLRDMEERLRLRPAASAMGFRQIDETGAFQLSFGPPPSLVLELARRFVQRRLDAGDARTGRWLERLFARPCRVPWVSGAALLVRRSAFERVGGFDERFFLYFEDIDLCLRLRAAGGEVIYDPGVVVCHARGASMRTAAARSARAYRESQLYFWRKHRGRAVAALVELYLRAARLMPTG